jgi:transposase
VPYRFARCEVEVRLTPRTVEIFLKGERVAAHLRSSGNHRHTTLPEHMPSSHRRSPIGPSSAFAARLPALVRQPRPCAS